jgi:hypothetical protein
MQNPSAWQRRFRGQRPDLKKCEENATWVPSNIYFSEDGKARARTIEQRGIGLQLHPVPLPCGGDTADVSQLPKPGRITHYAVTAAYSAIGVALFGAGPAVPSVQRSRVS